MYCKYSISYHENALPWVREFAKDEDASVRSNLGRSLAYLVGEDKRWLTILDKLVTDNNRNIRAVVAIALGTVYQQGWNDILRLLKKLADDDFDQLKISLVKTFLERRYLKDKFCEINGPG